MWKTAIYKIKIHGFAYSTEPFSKYIYIKTASPIHEKIYKPAEIVKHHHVSIYVIQIIVVGWIFFRCPYCRMGGVKVKHYMFWFRLIIHRIKSCYLVQTTKFHCYTLHIFSFLFYPEFLEYKRS